MAFFFNKTCRFNGCGISFKCVQDLIEHIESVHIDFDPRVTEKLELQQPASLSLSYIMRFVTDAAQRKKKKPLNSSNTSSSISSVAIKAAVSPVVSTHNTQPIVRNITPTGSEFDDDLDDNDSDTDSDNSWTTQEEYSAEKILSRFKSIDTESDKPFSCPIPNCTKRYKNVNGIKYHARNGHRKDLKVRKLNKCHCGKSYKSSTRLVQHSQLMHGPSSLAPPGNTAAHHTHNSQPATATLASVTAAPDKPQLGSPANRGSGSLGRQKALAGAPRPVVTAANLTLVTPVTPANVALAAGVGVVPPSFMIGTVGGIQLQATRAAAAAGTVGQAVGTPAINPGLIISQPGSTASE